MPEDILDRLSARRHDLLRVAVPMRVAFNFRAGRRFGPMPASRPLRPGQSVFISSCEIPTSHLRMKGPDEEGLDGPWIHDEAMTAGFAIDEATGYCLAFLVGGVPHLGGPSAVLALSLSDKSVWAAAAGAMSPWMGACVPETVVVDRDGPAPSSMLRERLSALGCNLLVDRASPNTRCFVHSLLGTLATVPTVDGPRGVWPRFDDSRLRERDPGIAEREAAVRRVVDVYHARPQVAFGGRTPADAWRHACETYGVPATPAPDRLAALFEREVTKRAWPDGLRVNGLTYASPELSARIAREGRPQLSVRIDPLDIGALAVRLDGRWRRVPCTEPTAAGLGAHMLWSDIVGYAD